MSGARRRTLVAVILILAVVPGVLAVVIWSRASRTAAGPAAKEVESTQAPPKGGYFTTKPAGIWSALPGDAACAREVHRSTWEPRPDNAAPNHVKPDAAAVHRAFAARPVSGAGATDPRWDSWLLQRVDGQFTGTTDEIFQWAACKWGLSDDLLRAMAAAESTWNQYETYPSGRPAKKGGSGDLTPAGTPGASEYCNEIARYGRDYQRDYGPGICPETFSIAGVKSWQAPAWGKMPGNQNGTFPFNRNSTAFAVDYLASHLRGCYNGWKYWLAHSGRYTAGDIWGCVGAWYSGAWSGPRSQWYILRVKSLMSDAVWLKLDWPYVGHACDPTFGCPGPGRL
jgi:hypothetical protein